MFIPAVCVTFTLVTQMWWKEPINRLHLLSVFDFFNKLIKLEFLIIEVSFQSN